MRQNPKPEDFEHAKRQARWSYVDLIPELLFWNFCFGGWNFFNPRSLIALMVYAIFSTVSVWIIVTIASREPVVGFADLYVPTPFRVFLLISIQLLLVLGILCFRMQSMG
jgi:hypothetical protein